MWRQIGIAFALFLIIEGLFPFASPAALRAMMLQMSAATDRQLRVAGFASMAIGVSLLYLVN